ncbi:MAG: DUF4384 domain-containing protein [Gemmatimonadales bacterium]|nr:DUF4384 domain-containing protein [Gemmatimonadales bacterium]
MSVALGWVVLAGLLASAEPASPACQPDRSPALLSGPGARAESRIIVWTDRESPYRRGERARIFVEALDRAYVTVLRVDTDGRVRVIFPSDPWGAARLRPGRTVELSVSRGGPGFVVDDDPGLGYLFAIASPEPFDYSEMTRGDFWDYRLINDGRVEGDPYVALTRLADRITAGGKYDYDIAPYSVDRHFEYPRFVCYGCHSSASYSEWNPYRMSCRRYRLEIYDDPAYYPMRYNRGRGVVADRPARPTPRFVFRDADPSRGNVTRRGGRPTDDGRADDASRRVREIPAPRMRRLPAREISPALGPEIAPGPVVPRGLSPMRDRPRSIGEPQLRRRRRRSG